MAVNHFKVRRVSGQCQDGVLLNSRARYCAFNSLRTDFKTAAIGMATQGSLVAPTVGLVLSLGLFVLTVA